MVDVRVGIVSWNTSALLDACLTALPAALGDLDAEVVVVDNDSADDSANVAAAHAGVEVVRNPENVGYARAMNQALDGTDAPVLVALNPDTAPAPGTLAALVARLRADARIGLVVPRLTHPDGRLQHSVYRFPSVALAATVCFVPPPLQRGPVGRRWWLEGAAPHDRSGPIDWAIGAVHVIRAAAVAPDPPYSERWFMYVEDLELCWRLHRRGWQVHLAADVEVAHVGNAAGSQAWGSSRAARYWTASYDFYAGARGAGAARRWALVNTVGATLHLLVRAVGALLPGRDRRRQRAVARDLARLVPVHAGAIRRPRAPG